MIKKLLFICDDSDLWTDLHKKIAAQFEIIDATNMRDAASALTHYKIISAAVVCISGQSEVAYEILDYIISNPVLMLIPVVAISDGISECEKLRLFDSGVMYCIERNCAFENIAKQINNLIHMRQMTNLSNSFHKEKETVDRLQAIMDNISSGVTATRHFEHNDSLLFYNKRFNEILGYSENSTPLITDVISPKDKDRVIERLQSMKVEDEMTLEFRAIKADGSELWVRCHFSIVCLFGVNGTVLLSVFEDITAEKEAQDMVILRSSLLDDAAIAVSVRDAETHKLLYVNKANAELCGKNICEATGQTCHSYLWNKNSPCKVCKMNVADDKKFTEFEYTDESTGRHYLVRAKYMMWDGKRSYVEFATDETALIEQRKRLSASHRALETASKNTGISFWRYDLDNKTVDWAEFSNFAYSGYKMQMNNMPESFVEKQYVHPEDAGKFIKMYDDIENNAETAECTVRILNIETGKYNCFHTVYTRLHDSVYKTRQAIGFAENVDLQMEMQAQHERELQLRNKFIIDATLYYELDLINKTVVEYYSKYDDIPIMKANSVITEEMRNDILEKVYADDREYVRSNLFSDSLYAAFLRGEMTRELIYRRLIGKNKYHWVKTTINILSRPENGSVFAFVCMHDVNEEEMNKLAISSVVAEDIELLVLVDVSSGMMRLIKTNHELSNKSLNEFYPYDKNMKQVFVSKIVKEDRDRCLEFLSLKSLKKELEKDSTVSVTYSVTDDDGSILKKRTVAYYLNENKTDILISRRDTTGIYKEEQRQKEILKAAADAADKANKAKGEFLSRMSHDMRTPMNSILGMVYLCKEEKPDAKIMEYLNSIDMSSKYLLGLINDVLDLSKIESGKTLLHEEPFFLGDFLRGISTIILPLMNAKNINFKIEMNCGANSIIVDPLRFNQVFYNLLSNAAKYTPAGGNVVFSSERIPDKNGKRGIRFHIVDDGIGMSEKFLKVIFTPFSQEHNSAMAEQQGTGLGLAIVKNLVAQMGGKVSVKSELGKGSEFIVDLYVKEAETFDGNGNKTSADFSGLKGLQILVVDDNQMNITISKSLLEHKGCTVTSVNSGMEAIDVFANSSVGHFDAILMDVRMPIMDGFETSSKIRKLDKEDSMTVPIVAMTADTFDDSKNGAIAAGMNSHLTKPIVPETLFEELLRLTGKNKTQLPGVGYNK